MNQLFTVVKKAQHSSFYLWILNFGLLRAIPFNKPHGFKIVELGEDHVTIKMPYKTNNLNHIKGLHACGLATVCEYAAGFSLIRKLDFSKYRLILEKLEMQYTYQGKGDAFVTFELDNDFIHKNVIEPLKNQDKVTVRLRSEVKDVRGNVLCIGDTYWQLKSWEKVKTKL